MSAFIPSTYQLDIFDWYLKDKGKNLVVRAVAGSGKSRTEEELIEQTDSSDDIVYLAFGKDIATSFQARIPDKRAVTYHSAGRSLCVDNFGKRLVIDNNKAYGILKYLLPKYEDKYLYTPIKKLAGLCKANLLEPTPENIIDLSLYHGIDINGDANKIIDNIQKLIQQSIRMTNVVDFDDMIYLPVILNLHPYYQYDSVFIDELQDTNRVQIELALKMVKPDGKIIGVGDENQSIYGFRGADVNAIPSLIERLNADTLPLSVTYRNPLRVVEYVNEKFPDIKFEASPYAIDGKVGEINTKQFINDISPDEMVLCRVNAPLVSYCFELIRNGVKANIKGKDIGDNLLTLIKKFKTDKLNDLLYMLSEFEEIETTKLYISKKESQAVLLSDKVNTIIAISEGCKEIEDVKSKISTIFSDDTPGVCLSSIHKAKGLEARKVSIIHPELLPHPLAKQDWQRQQEKNMAYVASTRSLEELYIVTE